ncbi:hypothetical protein T492DRAFT_832437 [Pavlovales sp. CCMP2436]|nr:hypothetical protein T492DRAFT_832437 [Pavlovales sp. CCMP2436]
MWRIRRLGLCPKYTFTFSVGLRNCKKHYERVAAAARSRKDLAYALAIAAFTLAVAVAAGLAVSTYRARGAALLRAGLSAQGGLRPGSSNTESERLPLVQRGGPS